MLRSADIICGKIICQLGYAEADDVRAQLRDLADDPSGRWDLVNGLRAAGKLADEAVEVVRHRTALYEHVRREAIYVRLLERETTIKKETVAKLLAQLEASAFRRRLGDVLVRRKSLTAEYDQQLLAQQGEAILKDDRRIIARYRKQDFSGVAKPLIAGAKLIPSEFKISTLFRSKETRALVDKAEIELLRQVARREAQIKKAAQDETMILDGDEDGTGAARPTTRAPARATARTKMVSTIPDPTPDNASNPFDPNAAAAPPAGGEPEAAALTPDDVRKLKRIADYSIVEVLGVGGMGAVFLGQKDGEGIYVAIKVLLNQQATAEETARFEREIILTQRIKHENVILIIDRGETDSGLTYIVVPALAGKELREVLDNADDKALDFSRIATVLRQTCAGLQAVHDSGVVHRDLKPENVFVMAGGRDEVKIMDFGLAKPDEENEGTVNVFRTTTGEVSGSPAYMAPESVTNDPIDRRTDIYSLGVMLFEMLTGTLPLESETTQGYLTQHLICPPLTLAEARPDVPWPAELESLVERMLGKTRAERPESCNAIIAELDAGLGAMIAQLSAVSDAAPVPDEEILEPENKASLDGWAFKGLLGRLIGRGK
jgi:serine/threonine protein kinase